MLLGDVVDTMLSAEMQPSLVLGESLWDHWGKKLTEPEVHPYS